MYQEQGKNQINMGRERTVFLLSFNQLYAYNIFLVGLIGALEVDEQLELFCP